MRVLVLGGSGMLGHQLCRVLSDRMETWATFREDPARFKHGKALYQRSNPPKK